MTYATQREREAAEKEAKEFFDHMQTVRETRDAVQRCKQRVEDAKREVRSAECELSNAQIRYAKARAAFDASLPEANQPEYKEALRQAKGKRR